MNSRGLGVIIAGYVFWGISPVYFKLLAVVPASEFLAHRIVWSAVLLIILLALLGQLAELRVSRRTALRLVASSLLIACNWITFIWAVTHDRMVETSFGYFICPLVSVLLGLLVLKEHLRPLQWAAIALAIAGVGVQLVSYGSIPWLALIIALSFSLYGLVRKGTEVGSLTGLAIETLLLAPVALGFIALGAHSGSLATTTLSPPLLALLLAAGAVTIFPLACFTYGVTRLPLSVVGLSQYITPTITLLMAVLIYREPFTGTLVASFGIIWVGLVLFSIDSLHWFSQHVHSDRALLKGRFLNPYQIRYDDVQ